MIAVIICGSRNWRDDRAIADVVNELPAGAVVIHGDAPGADRMAGAHAKRHGHTVVAMPAQWNRDGKAAGPMRNKRMLDVLLALGASGYTTKVIAFPMANSRGTMNMVNRALVAGVTVRMEGGDN